MPVGISGAIFRKYPAAFPVPWHPEKINQGQTVRKTGYFTAPCANTVTNIESKYRL
jgi:hypothetical protein